MRFTSIFLALAALVMGCNNQVQPPSPQAGTAALEDRSVPDEAPLISSDGRGDELLAGAQWGSGGAAGVTGGSGAQSAGDEAGVDLRGARRPAVGCPRRGDRSHVISGLRLS